MLFLITYADQGEDYEEALGRIENVLQEMERDRKGRAAYAALEPVPAASAAMSLRQVFYARKETAALEEAEGMICGEQVSFYPPGIPVLLPGEIISREIISYCLKMKKLGLPVSGPADSSLRTVRVVNAE